MRWQYDSGEISELICPIRVCGWAGEMELVRHIMKGRYASRIIAHRRV
jgi:hypothetical protein